MEAAIITTYRCNCKCIMCNIWRYPTKTDNEFSPSLLKRLPNLKFANITGGEPILREDIEEIISILLEKSKRVVISTNGYFTDKIIRVAKKNIRRNLGVRVSIEGLSAANDELRGLRDCFDRGLMTLLELKRMGLKDIGFGVTVSDRNARDMIALYHLAKAMDVEFATACVHNSYYFHKWDNVIEKKEEVTACFKELINEFLKTNKMKNWFRAYFNYGLINYINGKPRLLPCGAGEDMFFLDPFGEVRPCNGSDQANLENSMGNLKDKPFAEIWESDKAKRIRGLVKNCPKNCWMIGTVSPAMKSNFLKPAVWVMKNKAKSLLGERICIR